MAPIKDKEPFVEVFNLREFHCIRRKHDLECIESMADAEHGSSDSRSSRVGKRRKTEHGGIKPPQYREKGSPSSMKNTQSPTESGPENQPSSNLISATIAEEKRAAWLAALTRHELEEVAAGSKWRPGDLHRTECFVCKRAGGLIGCRNCPRVYHAGCAGLPSNYEATDEWDCPACALLGLDGIQDLRRVISVSETPTLPSPRSIKTIAMGTKSNERDARQGSIPGSISRLEVGLSSSDQEKSKKRSRYSTLPTEVDEALAVINRALEAASYSKSIITHMEARLHVAEQDLSIEKGRAALAVSRSNQNEISGLQDQIRQKDLLIVQLRQDNAQLKSVMEKHSTRVKELEDWKRRMKMMIDGDPDKP